MGHIFISYSHKDTTYAHGLADHLRKMGFDIWMDERLDYGSQWPLEIQTQLDACAAFILIMTPRSFASEWVQSELQRAKRKLKPIFPLLLEGDEPWLSVESTQYYDVRGAIFPDAKFYSAIKNVASTSQNIETFNRLPKAVPATGKEKPQPKMKTEVIVAIIGGFATVVAACAAMVGPLVGWMNREPVLAEASLPSTVVPSLTPQPLLETSTTFLPSPTSTATLPPTQLPTNTIPPTQVPPTVIPTTQAPPTVIPPTLEPPVGSVEWRQQLESLRDGTISSVLIVGKFRRPGDLVGLSLDDQRNILITELAGRTNQSGGYYQSLDNDTLAGTGAMLVFVRAAKIRTDQDIKTITDDDLRNIFIVEIFARTNRTDLQGLSNIQLVRVALALQW
jgi:hypothetical protein